MTNEELEIYIEQLVGEIQSKKYKGTAEEIAIQQILYFDKYVKENIDYGFEAINFTLNNPSEQNPYDSAYKEEGFFLQNETLKKRVAVCGSISKIAKIVFNRIGVKCDYVWGHFNIGTSQKPMYFGHRWNIMLLGTSCYMVDFTAGMIIHNIEKDENYSNAANNLLNTKNPKDEFKYLFFETLAPTQTIGGFKINENGTNVDDINELGFLNNCTKNPKEVFPNLSTIPEDYILEYVRLISSNKQL